MAQGLPCPNPTCTHTFAQAEVQSAAALKCPRCGHVFQFRQAPAPPAAAKPKPAPARAPVAPAKPKVVPPPAAAPPPKATAPPARAAASAPASQAKLPAPPLPLAKPVAVPSPAPAPAPEACDVDVVPAESEAAPLDPPLALAEGTGPLVRRRTARKKTWGWQKLTMAACVLLGLAGLGIGGFFLLRDLLQDDGSSGSGTVQVLNATVRNLKNQDEKVFKLSLPKDVWVGDMQLKTTLKALVALKSDAPAWLAVAVKDYGMHKPRNAELVQEAMERLEQYYGEALEVAATTEQAQLAGISGQRLTFKGQLNNVFWWGECYMLAHHGFGYWFFIAAPTLPEAQQHLAELQANNRGFVPVTERRGWREQPPPRETFFAQGLPVSLSAPQGVFSKHDHTEEDAKAKLLLLGRYLKEKDNRKNAHVVVLALTPQPELKEAIKEARTYIEEIKKNESKDNRVTAVDEKPEAELGVLQDVGNRRGRVGEFALYVQNQPARYYLLAVVNDGDSNVVVWCDATWDSRAIWRQDFLELLRTVTFKQAPKEEPTPKEDKEKAG